MKNNDWRCQNKSVLSLKLSFNTLKSIYRPKCGIAGFEKAMARFKVVPISVDEKRLIAGNTTF